MRKHLFKALFLLLLCFYTHACEAYFDAIEANCSADECHAAGLHKLSGEERRELERLMYESAPQYPAMIPNVKSAAELTWIYEAQPFCWKGAAPLADACYDESAMAYDLAVCTIFQHEAPWLKEWLEYHKLMGAQHFYLYNNGSSDGYLEVLEPYIKSGEVELIQFPVTTFPPATQNYAYQDGIVRARGKARWLAIIDTDEFIVPMAPYANLLELLAEYENYGGLGINWQMHGTAGVKSIPGDRLMIEMLTRKAPQYHRENWYIKSVVKPHRVASIGDPHYCIYANGFGAVDSAYIPPCRSQNHRIYTDKVCINHYWYRTEDYYYHVKVPRRIKYEGKPRDPDSVKQHMDTLNAEESTAILRFVPQLRENLGMNP